MFTAIKYIIIINYHELNTGEIHYYKWNAFNKLNHWIVDN